MTHLPEISVKETKAKLAEDGHPLLLDCREPNEWDFCRIEGALLVPLSNFKSAVEPVPLGPEGAIIYCHHGVRSLHATRYLLDQGYENIVSMAGGIDAWSLEVDEKVPRY